MTKRKQTQGRWLIEALQQRSHTYMQMLAYGVSVAPWMRVRECLRPDERIVKGSRMVGGRKLVTWRVVKA